MATENKNKDVSSEKLELRDKEKIVQSPNPSELLDKSLDALQKEGGFKLLRGLVRDIEKMDPAKKASKKAFLSEMDFADTRKRMQDEIKVLISILEGESKDPMDIVEKLNHERDKIQNLLGENLNTLHRKIQKLEVAYRTLSSFFANAGQRKIDCITLMNVNKAEMKTFVCSSWLSWGWGQCSTMG